jgi:pilus assembly protein CpaB
MNQRVLTILFAALVLSAGATYLVYRLVVNRVAQTTLPTVQVVMANRTLKLGEMITADDLKTGPWVGGVPAGAVPNKEAASGRGVIAPIYEGEVVLEGRLAAPGAGGGLAATIPQGMRACAVKVNEIVGVAGFAVPGLRVDVLIAGNPPGPQAAAGPRVKTLLQNIEILSAGQNYQKDAEGKPVSVQVVNLLVTPEQAELLSLASNETRIQLVLRNPLDVKDTKTSGSALASLFSGAVAPPPPAHAPVVKKIQVAPPPPPPPPANIVVPAQIVQVYNGPRQSEVKFARPDEEKK